VIELEDIIARCKKYDVTAQRILYERYVNHLHLVCMRYISDKNEVKDIVHDSFIKIFANIKQYSGKGKFEGWMVRIAINTALKHIRKYKKKQYISITDKMDDTDTDSEQPTEEINNYERIEQLNLSSQELMDVIMTIPEPYRIVFNLFHIDEFSHEEISEKLKIGINNSRTRLHRACQLIRIELFKKADKVQNKNTLRR
jgi:RNA polymerase sigma factor (sigma-70 family)